VSAQIAQDKEDAKRKREQEEAQSFKELFEHTEAMVRSRGSGAAMMQWHAYDLI
jgi:hypothetical protein